MLSTFHFDRVGVICLCLMAAGAAGCDQGLSPESQKMLDSGRAAYEAKDDKLTVQIMDQFIAANARSKYADEGYYWRGLAKLRMGDVPAARADFGYVIDHSTRGDVLSLAHKAMGDISFDSADMSTARAMYSQALRYMKDGQPPIDFVRYRLAQALQRLGQWEDADFQFNRLRHTFPDGELSKRASRQVHCRAWTVQAAAFKERRAADYLAARLKNDALDAQVVPVTMESEALFAVQVGRFGTHDQAEAIVPQVKATAAEAFVTVTR